MPFKQGQSGNPQGRPKKDRALTNILETEGAHMVDLSDGSRIARRRLMARLLWQAVETGKVELPNGTSMIVSPDDWLDIIQFLYKHIDGPPKTALDNIAEKIDSVTINVKLLDDESDD